MVNIVRNIKPSLISLSTATRDLDKESLRYLADVILFAERNYIHKFRKNSTEDNVWTQELYTKFARQLGLDDEKDLKDFKIGGLALMLSDDLYPHVDGLNPKGNSDLTIQFNFQVFLSELDTETRTLVIETFGKDINSLPFTLILYPRKCVINYGKRQEAVKQFPDECPQD